MSHYTIDYANVVDAEARAIEDIKSWLGEERYALISGELKKAIASDPDLTADHLRLPLSMAGIQGYPVQAWFNVLSRE